MDKTIEQLILNTLIEINEELEKEELYQPTAATKLYGEAGTLDSLALVSVLSDIEQRVSDELGIDIVLADERAMSQRTSPFRDVASLTSYIEKLIKEQG